MKRFSEYVSLGHPDKIADYISQYLLDRYIEKDPETRYAVEVQIKDNHVTLGGEVASKAHFYYYELLQFVREAVNEIGYTKEYQDKWGKENTICGDDLTLTALIGEQSPEIAQGLQGWGDQGIFFGMCSEYPQYDGMPFDHHLAKAICKTLFESGIGGLDIKTQVFMDNDKVEKVVVAIPLLDTSKIKDVKEVVSNIVALYEGGMLEENDIVVNGTGSYVRHSTLADCGTTGRKLTVDFYGGNCIIGGGSPWTKDASKADLTLNLYARHLAKSYIGERHKKVFTKIACTIGKDDVEIVVLDEKGNVINEATYTVSPLHLRKFFGLDKPIYASMCRWGLFGMYQRDKVWEKPYIESCL